MPVINKNETLADFVTGQLGTVNGLFYLAMLNGISITEDVAAGVDLIADKTAFNLVFKPVLKGELIVTPFQIPAQEKELAKHQTVFDFVCQHAGELDAVFEMAKLNGISITETSIPGMQLKVKATNEKVVAAFIGKEYNIMSEIDGTGLLIVVPPGGIGFMKIEETFKSS